MKERVMWYGLEREGKKYLFRDIFSDPAGVLRRLREGEIPEVEESPGKETPDLRETALKFARERIRESYTADLDIIKQVQFKKELDRIINLYYERIMGFSSYIGSDAFHADPCSLFRGSREKGYPDFLIRIMDAGKELCDLRSVMVDRIRQGMEKLMPNTCSLAGPDLASEILERSGGFRRLSHMSAGTLQLLGAEKALFSHTTRGTPPPKHGLIFKFPGISSLPRVYRGKISRTVANKLSICVRADIAGSHMDTRDMKENITNQISSLRDLRKRKTQ